MSKEWVVSDEDLGCDGAYFSYKEIIRCRDCIHHEDDEPGTVWCNHMVGSWVPEDWFCADGERRAERRE